MTELMDGKTILASCIEAQKDAVRREKDKLHEIDTLNDTLTSLEDVVIEGEPNFQDDSGVVIKLHTHEIPDTVLFNIHPLSIVEGIEIETSSKEDDVFCIVIQTNASAPEPKPHLELN